MKKVLIIIVILGVLGAGGYFGYNYLSTPTGFTTKVEVVESFFEHINDTDVCETHFDSATQENCAHIVTLLKDDTLVVERTSVIGGEMNLTLSINGNEGQFVVTFTVEEETGFQARFNSEYYKISFIE